MSESERPSLWAIASQGTELAALVVALGFAGWYLDKWLNSFPWFLLLFILAAVITEAFRFWKLSKQFLN